MNDIEVSFIIISLYQEMKWYKTIIFRIKFICCPICIHITNCEHVLPCIEMITR